MSDNDKLRRSSWLLKIVLFSIIILVCAIAGEVAVRLFWRVQYNIALREAGLILYAYYPELRPLARKPPSHSDDFYDILLLGGSVLHHQWGTVELELLEQLARAGHQNVRVFNLAQPAHTSRDSLLKYASLGEARFELVIFYHGINDVRANNVPPEIFRDDYGHYAWYEIVNDLAPFHKTSWFALPYTLRYIALRTRQLLNKNRYILNLRHPRPRSEWVQYGRVHRSVAPFQANLKAIHDLASQRGDRMLLMTFAIHIPENYSEDAFKHKRLDYLRHLIYLETWGNRNHVMATVAAHNDVVRFLSTQNDDVLFVDQASLMERSARYFNDSCHLTTLGSSKFVKHLLTVLLPTFNDERSYSSDSETSPSSVEVKLFGNHP